MVFETCQLAHILRGEKYAHSVLEAFGFPPVTCCLSPVPWFSSGWIFHPLDDPYRLFVNNDAGSSGIAANATKIFLAHYASNRLHIRSWQNNFSVDFFRFL